MICPICGTDMEQGVIESAEAINFLMTEQFINKPDEANGEFSLARPGMVKRAVKEACVCRNCRKVIIDF